MAKLIPQLAMEINYAPTAFQLLRGCFCIYKPSLKGYAKTQLAIRQKLTQGLFLFRL